MVLRFTASRPNTAMRRTELVALAGSVRCWPYRIKVREEFAASYNGVVIDVMIRTLDSETYLPTKIAMSHSIEAERLEFMDIVAAKQWLFNIIRELALHELGEFFTVQGQKPFYPHGDAPVSREPIEVDRWKAHGQF